MNVLYYLVSVRSGSSSSTTTDFQPQSIVDPTSPSGYSFIELANLFVAYAILIAGFLSLVFMLWGGISFILSGGKDEKVKSAIATIRYSLIGLIITILSITVINIVGAIFGFELVNYLSFSYILDTVNTIFQ